MEILNRLHPVNKKSIIMKQIMLLVSLMIMMAGSPAPQTIEIKGTVYSADDKSPLPAVSIIVKGSTIGTVTDVHGKYHLKMPQGGKIVFSMIGYVPKELTIAHSKVMDVYLETDAAPLEEVVVTGLGKGKRSKINIRGNAAIYGAQSPTMLYQVEDEMEADYYPVHNTENYASINENIFHKPSQNPLSTFSIDVDAASYSNIRRFLQQGQAPPKDAVRIEEMVNYFNYTYQQPNDEHPFSVFTELTEAPWKEGNLLLHIGLQGKKIPTDNLPPSNLVFLIDVSGSMNSPNKLGLLKSAFKLLSDQLRPQDKVSIVVYAGAAGVVLSATDGDHKTTIIDALQKLQAGGSTAGGAGIKLAYKLARENFVEGGNNRIILATDGDFNIGESSDAAMERLIEKEREHGVFLTVLGFGMGNYKDSKMEILADKGNGNYAYIDNIMEAKKVLVNEFGGTLFTIAKDVKLQLEFNPAHVKGYRLIGYENRLLRDEDFNDDKKDAGELGSGHTVTALYEIIPVGTDSDYIRNVDDLKYQKSEAVPSKDLMTLKLRYKQPDGHKSRLITHVANTKVTSWKRSSENTQWSAAVASFGMMLRDSEFKGDTSFDQIALWAQAARGLDEEGYRAEFIRLVQSSALLAKK